VDADRLLDGLDPSQRRAVTATGEPLAILAGAGSGKTRVLTRRIAHRCATEVADPRHVLAITFTRKAAQELDSRLRALGLRDLPAAGTFHAVAYAQLRTRWASTGAAAPTLLDRKGRLLARILGSTTRFSVGDLATEIEWARARLVDPDRYPLAAAQADRRLPVDTERVAEWFRRYEQDKRKRGLVDFDDLLSGCAHAIETDPAFAAAQRWRFRHLFVDEYQDLNPLQERLLRAWLGDRRDLTVVGDPDQAIYGWNGADASYLERFADHHPGAEVIRLDHTYRSTPQILRAAATVLGDGDPARAPSFVAHRQDGPVPTVVGYATDRDEANGIARAVHDHHAPGRPWSAQAVLVRTNAQVAVIEEAFRRGAIPCTVRGSSGLLDDPEIKELLRTLDRSRDPLATTVADLDARLDQERSAAAVDDADDGTPDERTSVGRRLSALESIVRLGRDLLVVDPTARTEAFAGWLRTTLGDEDDQRDAVAIATFHAAKGLEWRVVHLAGLEAGLVPITHARTPETRAEERRLLYVALTRAEDVLRCSWAAQRTFGDRTVDRAPSPFLAWLRDTSATLAAEQRDATDPRAALAASRAALARTDGADPVAAAQELRGALRTWREREAAKARVSPTVVLSDRAVEDLVRARPGDPDALASVGDVAPAIRERHGARLLAIIAEHP
jgi:DNA helicase-2/ATP-dependent DNA helicase PcrA